MEDLVEQMRRDITVTITGDSFRVSYVNRTARVAQQVAARLASLFIEENLRDRENQAESTSEFLDAQLEDAKRRLIEHEKRLEEYRRRYGGELPSQLAANLQSIQNLQLQVQTVAESTNRDRERRFLLERQIADLEQDVVIAPAPATATAPGTAAGIAPPEATTLQRLQTARRNLEVFESRFTDDHPDVRAMRRSVAELEARVEAEQREQRARPPSSLEDVRSVTLTPAEAVRARRLRDLRMDLQNLDAQIEEKRVQETRLRGQIADYQSKVDAVPTRESEMVDLTRDYATLQSMYAQLAAKREDSKIAANLERRQIGEQFKVLDPASVPEKPFSPNRVRLNSIGAAIGLVFGLAIVVLLEYRDSTFKTDDEVMRCLNMPVLAVVPIMVSPADLRRQVRRRNLIAVASVSGLLVGGGAIAVWRMFL
jgi:polysaccharide chain length determinant protein (PEP-CTERM system associated)